MPRVIAADGGGAITLAEFVERLDAAGGALCDEEGLADQAPLLARLAANDAFLGDIVIDELEQRCRNQRTANRYSAQVIMLHRAPGRYFIRANFWPSAGDPILRASGTEPFFYDVPHDHNFSFLTVGYLGPGYWSDYYDYDYEQVTGFPGEPVALNFVERSRLEQGRMLLYRAHRDVHRQLPADSMSVSINIVQTGAKQAWRDQYRFDLERCTVDGLLNLTPTETLVALSAHFGRGAEVVEHFATSHPSDRIRFAAIRALAGREGDAAARAERLERGARQANRFVSASCGALLDAIAI